MLGGGMMEVTECVLHYTAITPSLLRHSAPDRQSSTYSRHFKDYHWRLIIPFPGKPRACRRSNQIHSALLPRLPPRLLANASAQPTGAISQTTLSSSSACP